MKGLKIIWVYCIFALILATISVTAAPSATSVKVLPESPNAGQELICNYTYMHPSNYTEQNSSYEWWKNGVNQNINNQILAKSNLTPGDNWYCKVTPNDGVSLGTKQQSSNTVTILNATLNPVFYVNGVAVWNESGYFGSRTNVLGLNQEFASGLGSCVPDEEGYCNITLTFYSGNNGILNLTDMMVYYLNYTIDIEPKNDSESCSSGSECLSNYCDGDGAGLADDNWCFTPYSTYFDGQETNYCEYSTGSGTADCDERQVGDNITGCTTSGQNYFGDKCSSSCWSQDSNICRSSAYASGCTADSRCNGIVAGTGDCDAYCNYYSDQLPNCNDPNLNNLTILSITHNLNYNTSNVTINLTLDDSKFYLNKIDSNFSTLRIVENGTGIGLYHFIEKSDSSNKVKLWFYIPGNWLSKETKSFLLCGSTDTATYKNPSNTTETFWFYEDLENRATGSTFLPCYSYAFGGSSSIVDDSNCYSGKCLRVKDDAFCRNSTLFNDAKRYKGPMSPLKPSIMTFRNKLGTPNSGHINSHIFNPINATNDSALSLVYSHDASNLVQWSNINVENADLTQVWQNWTLLHVANINGGANNVELFRNGVSKGAYSRENSTILGINQQSGWGGDGIDSWWDDYRFWYALYNATYVYNSLPDQTKFLFKDNTGSNIARFGDAGNIILKGKLEQSSSHARLSTFAFVIRNNGNDVLIVENNGSMYIDGTLAENQGSLSSSTTNNDFRIKDSSGNLVAYVNEFGYLFLKGTLTQNGNP